jgi:dTDP-4-amino-4,6-dideoxygalactose transaminase
MSGSSHVIAALGRGTPAAAPAPIAAPGAPLIRLQRPELPPAEDVLAYFQRSIDAQYFSNGGPCARLLTERLEQRLGAGVFCVLVSSCTTGLVAALRAALGSPAGPRRVVLTPSYTFTATACAIEWAGFDTAFVDVEPGGWHLDARALEDALERFGDRVAGVLACAAFGTAPPATLRAGWRSACERHGVPLLVDSAPGFGALDVAGNALGAVGDTEIFSFHATKPFAIGEGGLVATPDPDLAARIARLVNFGLEPGTRTSVEVGFNGKLSELHAATGLAMLDRFPGVLAARRANAARLRDLLAGTSVLFQAGADGSTWQVVTLIMPTPAARERAVELAPVHGVETRTMHDPPLHRHPAFAGRERGPLPVTDVLAERTLCLPMANTMSERELERIAALVRAALQR